MNPTKPRHAEGGAYCSRGRWYARVIVAPRKRESVLLSWARPRPGPNLASAPLVELFPRQIGTRFV